MGNKRLQDDFLNVSVLAVQFGNGFQRRFVVGRRFADADEQTRRKRHLRPSGRGQRRQPQVGRLPRRMLMGRLPEQLPAGCLQHHPQRDTNRAQTAEFFLRLIADVDVRQQTLFERQPAYGDQIVVVVPETPGSQRRPQTRKSHDAFPAHNERLMTTSLLSANKTARGFFQGSQRRRARERTVATGKATTVGGNERQAVGVRDDLQRLARLALS